MALMSRDKQIDDIMDWFDFGSVAKVMEALEWTWAPSGEVPAEPEIRKHARSLLRRLKVHKDDFIGCGGFEAENNDGLLSLKFVVSEWTAQEEGLEDD